MAKQRKVTNRFCSNAKKSKKPRKVANKQLTQSIQLDTISQNLNLNHKGYVMSQTVNQIIITDTFAKWLNSIKNPIAKATIARRIKNATTGNFVDHKSLTGTGGLYEMRIATGAGYRIYYAKQGNIIYILLHGGEKSIQQRDIEKAKALWIELKQTGDN